MRIEEELESRANDEIKLGRKEPGFV